MLLAASPALAVPMQVDSFDTPSQDPLHPHVDVHELGNMPPFPQDEWITSSFNVTSYRPCLQNPDTQIPNALVIITNKTNQDWYKVVYVADPETTLANDDGFVNGELAFNIDNNIGDANNPLISESISVDNVFQVGETWEFVIQDYMNAFGLPPSLFGTIGVGNMSAGDVYSSGSIIAVPEPATMSLLALGGLAVLKRRRRR
jgi:hypothetical protein